MTPNKADVHRLPRPPAPLTKFEHSFSRGRQGLVRDNLKSYNDLAVDRQRR